MTRRYLLFGLVCFFLGFAVHVDGSERIKLYAFYTPSHKVFLDKWFLASLQDDYEIILECYDQSCESGDFMKGGWIETMLHKVDLVLRGIKENWGKVFIHSDIDIQFFRPTQKVILDFMQDQDMVVQRDRPSEGKNWKALCAGFFACRGNEKTLKLWSEIRRRLSDKKYIHDNPITNDQEELNYLLIKNNIFDVRWKVLSDEFFGGGTRTGKRWNPGDSLPIPAGIFMHHANWTVGLDNKLAQLEYVRALQKK